MEQITRALGNVEGRQREIARVGADLAKRIIQVHGVDGAGVLVCRRALPCEKFLAWCARLPAGCVVAMEISSGAHHWARRLMALGLQPRLMSAQLVEPYRSQGSTGKNDANDAAAICEAASRPTMRFVPVKSIEQQSMLCVHRLREGLKAERTACINRIRGLLAEFGVVHAQGSEALRRVLTDMIEDATNEMNALARRVMQRAQAQWRELDAAHRLGNERIAEHAHSTTVAGPHRAAVAASVASERLSCVTARGDTRCALAPGLARAALRGHGGAAKNESNSRVGSARGLTFTFTRGRGSSGAASPSCPPGLLAVGAACAGFRDVVAGAHRAHRGCRSTRDDTPWRAG